MTEYQVDPTGAFRDAISEAISKVSDLRIPYTLLVKSWFQGNKAIFALKGPGKYKDLKLSTKKAKIREHGSAYPILKNSGALEQSLTEPTDSDSIAVISGKYTLILGTKKSYAPFLQYGTKFMPARPVVLWGAEQTAPAELNKRVETWIEIVNNYVLQVSAKVGKVQK